MLTASPAVMCSLGLWAQLPWPESWAAVPSVLPPLCVPVHPPLNVQICGNLWHPSGLSRGTFVELWMLYWL